MFQPWHFYRHYFFCVSYLEVCISEISAFMPLQGQNIDCLADVTERESKQTLYWLLKRRKGNQIAF